VIWISLLPLHWAKKSKPLIKKFDDAVESSSILIFRCFTPF